MTKDIVILTLVTLPPAIFGIAMFTVLTVFFAEVFPANVRVSDNIGFQFGQAIGGFAPYITTYLFSSTNNLLLSFAYVAVGSLIVSLISWLWMPETKGWDYLRTIPKLAKK